MRLLRRHTPGPSVLNNYDYASNNWDCLSSSDKKQIWEEITKMQGKLCAYCEKKIPHHASDNKKAVRHIEHFFRKGIYKELTFEWSNLFGSCGETNRCGFYKDKQNYNDNELIKADKEDPDDFFQFSETGEVEIKPDLKLNNKKKAEVTLRVFNLNPPNGGVKAERRRAIQSSLPLIKNLVDIASNLLTSGENIDDVRCLVFEEFHEKIIDRSFPTAIRHVFENRMP
ncbi:retron Ec78 anti-phage system effector HNH endonuclease PtuB [Lonsdalea quercina]|uniref:retron Ec78 anti-phage system effector HNH endonuclease PtuB n=1 Tax=Lonsdalea quercina TaxID=71657 RepID=UPI0039765F8D